METTFRQGDVLIMQVSDDTDVSGEIVERDKGEVILAYGERSGHHHHILEPEVVMTRVAAPPTSGMRMFGELPAMAGDGVYLTSTVPFTVRHEEHAPVELPAGKFKVIRQREYEPQSVRFVAD